MAETKGPPLDIGYLLGKIESTTSDTAENVRALRVEMGVLAARLAETEKAVAEIQAERSIMVPEYRDFTKRVRQHMETATAVATASSKLAESVERIADEVRQLQDHWRDDEGRKVTVKRGVHAAYALLILAASALGSHFHPF